MKKKFFQEVYPFTTEEISGYFPLFDFTGKDVFTVGSSSDQAFNALLLGAKNITVFDINENTAKFGRLKRDIIINSSSIKKFYKDTMAVEDVPYSKDVFPYPDLIRMNLYMQTKENFSKLQDILINNPNAIEYITGDIFDLDNSFNKKYDIMILSNVLQYMDLFIGKEEDPYVYLKQLFEKLKINLNNDGVIQLIYYYVITNNNFKKTNLYSSTSSIINVMKTLESEKLLLEMFDSGKNDGRKDGILTYKKK